MKHLLAAFIIITSFSACEKTPADLIIDEIKEEQYKTAMDLSGTWQLTKVRYHHELDTNDTFITTLDTVYTSISGNMEFRYLQEEEIEGMYDWTFNDTTDVKSFTGHTLNYGVEALSLKFMGWNPHFTDFNNSDFIIEKLKDGALRINRKRLVPDYYRENWYLSFTKQ